MQDIRWKQRYSSYREMLNVLDRNLQYEVSESTEEIVHMALAKNLEFCFELMWKLLKDYLQHNDVEIGLISPKNVLKTAANSGLLEQMDVDGDVLMHIHETRNKLVHTYNQEKMQDILKGLKETFFPEMIKVDDYFRKLASSDE